MKIVNHKVVEAEFRQARCHSGSLRPTLIVLHETAGRLDKYNSVKWFQSPKCDNASAHFIIERDGTVVQCVLLNVQAWHAGKSSYNGRANVNGFSIGIELVGPGELTRKGNMAVAYFGQTWTLDEVEMRQEPTHGNRQSYWLDYTPEQIDAVTELCQALVEAYPEIHDITTHWAISPGRKVDTNPLFPLGMLKAAVLDAPSPVGVPVAMAGEMDERFAIPAADPPNKSEGVPAKAGIGAVTGSVSGWLDTSDKNFSVLKRLSEQGSRVANAVRTAKMWFWGVLGGGSAASQLVDTKKGTGGLFLGWVEAHPFLFVGICLSITAVLVYWFVLKRGEKFLATAYRDGRYTPRGSPQ